MISSFSCLDKAICLNLEDTDIDTAGVLVRLACNSMQWYAQWRFLNGWNSATFQLSP